MHVFKHKDLNVLRAPADFITVLLFVWKTFQSVIHCPDSGLREWILNVLRCMLQFEMLPCGALRTGNIMVTRKQVIMPLVFGHWDLT